MFDVVDIGRWELDPDNPYGPQGAKPKRFVLSPSPPTRLGLVSGHRYLFKEPEGFRAQQIWSEVIAYQLGQAMGLPVPPAYLALDHIGKPGVLVEFFYGHLGAPIRRLVHAIELFQQAGRDVSHERGSLRDNIWLTRTYKVTGWKEWWAKAIAFDAIIGNTDRHSENWGFLVQQDTVGPVYEMAPLFDNGTSLGFQQSDSKLNDAKSSGTLDVLVARNVERGLHHCGWTYAGTERGGHADLCKRFQDVYGDIRPLVTKIIGLHDSTIEGIVHAASRQEYPIPFTAARSDFVFRLVKAKRDALVAALGG